VLRSRRDRLQFGVAEQQARALGSTRRMTRVHLVRHGRTASNRERRTMGWLDEGIEPGWVRAAAAVADRVGIRVMGYRKLTGERFDAVVSIGMVEHGGSVQIDLYAQQLAGLLEPEGRLLNHGIARVRHGDPEAGSSSGRYGFPNAAPLHLSRVLGALERAGFAAEHVEGFTADYAETLTHSLTRLEDLT